MDLFFSEEQPSVEPTGLTPAQVEDEFRKLFQHVLANSPKSLASVADALGMTPRNLRRLLGGHHKLTTQILVELGNVLGIDKTRAVVASERFKDWQTYNDPTLIIAVDLLKPVVDTINDSSRHPLEPLHPKAVEQLAKWIAQTVVEHQARISARREQMELRNQF